MPTWVWLLITLLGWLLQWLDERDELTPAQIERMNKVMRAMRDVRAEALKLGCSDYSKEDW